MFSRAQLPPLFLRDMYIANSTSKYRHKIIIRERSTSRDATGGEQETWSDKCSVMASIEQIKKREYTNDGKLITKGMYLIGFRYDSRTQDIDETMRIKYGSRTFEIIGIKNVYERDIKFEVDCKELV